MDPKAPTLVVDVEQVVLIGVESTMAMMDVGEFNPTTSEVLPPAASDDCVVRPCCNQALGRAVEAKSPDSSVFIKHNIETSTTHCLESMLSQRKHLQLYCQRDISMISACILPPKVLFFLARLHQL